MKKIFIIVVLIILTGCNATYKLEFRDNVLKEKISIQGNNLKYFTDNKFYAVMDGASNFVEYTKRVKNNSVNFNHNYSFKNYSNATVLKTCFNAYSIIEEDDYYILSTSKGIKCAVEEDSVLLDNLKIVIKTNHVVEESNANSNGKKSYEYVWEFDKNDYNDAKIYMKLYKDKYVFNYNNEFVILISIIAGIILTILFTAFIIVRKVKNAQKV